MIYKNILTNIIYFMLMISYVNAQQFHSIYQTISIEESGSAIVQMEISFTATDSINSIRIPAEYEELNVTSAFLDDTTILDSVSIVFDRTTPVYNIIFNKPLTGLHFILLKANLEDFLEWEKAGPKEFRTYNWEVTYINTLPVTIEKFNLTVILPLNWNFHRITGSEPKFEKKQPKPPYIFAMKDDRASVSISKYTLEYMESVGLEFAFKNVQKPTILIIVGVVLSILYLYFFRKLVVRRDSGKSNDSNQIIKERK